MAANLVAACMLLFFVWLVWLAAYRRKGWPRWVAPPRANTSTPPPNGLGGKMSTPQF